MVIVVTDVKLLSSSPSSYHQSHNFDHHHNHHLHQSHDDLIVHFCNQVIRYYIIILTPIQPLHIHLNISLGTVLLTFHSNPSESF
jgi:hypothetical protein